MAVREQQHRVAMHRPEAAQELMGRVRQRYEAIPIALGVANMHTLVNRVDIADLKSQTFTQAQSEAVESEEEHPVAENAGSSEDPLGLLDADDVGQALALGRLDQAGGDPGLAQDIFVVELRPVQIELDRTPRVRTPTVR